MNFFEMFDSMTSTYFNDSKLSGMNTLFQFGISYISKEQIEICIVSMLPIMCLFQISVQHSNKNKNIICCVTPKLFYSIISSLIYFVKRIIKHFFGSSGTFQIADEILLLAM